MPDHVISMQDVTKSYGSFRLGPLDLELEPGYVYAVVGPNGSGKSTMFRLLMNLVHPDAGEVRLFDKTGEDDVSAKARIGYVPERTTGQEQMKVGDLGAFTARWFPTWDLAGYEGALDAMGVERSKQFGTLSKGMQRRVAFALALASDPELLVLDELTDGVDPFARRDFVAEIGRYMEPGDRTIVFATHNMDEVRRLADFVIFLVDGAYLGMYEKDALLDSWRRIRVERLPDEELPGVVRVGHDWPAELVSEEWRATAAALEERGIVVEQAAPLELAEILEELMTREHPDAQRKERSSLFIV